MALTKRTRIREVLIVQDDTTLLWSAHQVPITEILDAGKVVSATYAPAEALAAKDIDAVLSKAFIDITNERDTALADKKAAEEAAKEALAKAEQERDGFKADTVALAAERDAALANIVALKASADDLV